MTTVYVDTSAWGKIVKDEPESEAIVRYVDDRLDAGDDFVSSAVLVTEMGRLAERYGVDQTIVADVLDLVNIFTPDMSIFRDAGRLPRADLRSLDALHLAHCIALDVDLLASYDARQIAAARALGIRTVSPGVPDAV